MPFNCHSQRMLLLKEELLMKCKKNLLSMLLALMFTSQFRSAVFSAICCWI